MVKWFKVLNLISIDDLKVQLSKYLLRTLCTDMTNQVIKYIAEGYNIAVPENMEMFNKVRERKNELTFIVVV